jgi:hypothetical protein
MRDVLVGAALVVVLGGAALTVLSAAIDLAPIYRRSIRERRAGHHKHTRLVPGCQYCHDRRERWLANGRARADYIDGILGDGTDR